MIAEKSYQASVTGRKNKAAGEHWENMIEASCQYYRFEEIAEITKTPEPMHPIKSLGQGKFVAYYQKMAQPDYKGTLSGGKAIVFEAKHTDAEKMMRSVISSEQEKQLDRHEKLGAECFVMVSFGFRRFFKIPWNVFRDMKEHYGRKYITPEDIRQYEIKYLNGVLYFL